MICDAEYSNYICTPLPVRCQSGCLSNGSHPFLPFCSASEGLCILASIVFCLGDYVDSKVIKTPTLMSFYPFNTCNYLHLISNWFYTAWKGSHDLYFLNGYPVDPGQFLKTSFPENILVVVLLYTVVTCIKHMAAHVQFCFCICWIPDWSPPS